MNRAELHEALRDVGSGGSIARASAVARILRAFDALTTELERTEGDLAVAINEATNARRAAQ